MVKELLISFTIVLLTTLTAGNLYGEKDIIQINTLNEVDLVEEIPYFDAIDYVQLDENDKLYDMRYMGAYGEIPIVMRCQAVIL